MGALVAVGAAVEFILGIERLRKQDLALPLAMLIGALHDLDDGKQPALLAPAKREGRSPDSHAVQSVRTYAAWTMDWLMRLGSKKSDAARDIAGVLTKIGFSFGQYRGSPPKTVASWRDRLKRSNAAEFEALAFWDLMESEVTFGTEDKNVPCLSGCHPYPLHLGCSQSPE